MRASKLTGLLTEPAGAGASTTGMVTCGPGRQAVGHRAEQRVGVTGQGAVDLVDLLVGAGGPGVRAELSAGADHRGGGLVPAGVDAVADGGADGRAEAGGVVDGGTASGAAVDVGDDLHHQVGTGPAPGHQHGREPAAPARVPWPRCCWPWSGRCPRGWNGRCGRGPGCRRSPAARRGARAPARVPASPGWSAARCCPAPARWPPR